MDWKLMLAIAFHLLPVVPMIQGRWAGAIAAVLIVVVPYIKNKKLTIAIESLEKLDDSTRPELLNRELQELKAARRRWQLLTLPLSRILHRR